VSADGSHAGSAAASLGRKALAEILTKAEDGICLLDDQRCYVYANPAACALLGESAERLTGRSFLETFPVAEHATILAQIDDDPERGQMPFTLGFRDAQGAEHDVVCSTYPIELDGRAGRVAILRDLTGPRAAARRAVALAQTAAQLVGTGATLNEILSDISRHAFEGTRALAAGIVVMGEDRRLDGGGGYGEDGPSYSDTNAAWNALNSSPGDDVIRSLGAGAIIVGDPPGKPVVLPDARALWHADPVVAPFAAMLDWADWKAAVCIPLSWENRVIGLLGAYLPADVSGPNEDELAFCTALADQAAVAVINARLTSRASEGAALRERARLARELHDSVSQALFSMTMHARAAQLALARIEPSEPGRPLVRSLDQLADLTRTALAEMRALVFELRPSSLADRGLVEALRQQGVLLAARDELTVTVEGPDDRLTLDAAVEEHLYRIATEALHNVVKHAYTDRADVSVMSRDGGVRLTVTDRGAGFDTAIRKVGHLGMTSMAQRAESIGATLSVVSAQGSGTTVEVVLPGLSGRP
jgi:PAS domain S-box-containing protein